MLTFGEYQPGDRVRVIAEGIYEPKGQPRGWADQKLRIRVDDEHCVLIPLGAPGVTVERLAPPEPEVPVWWERRGPGMSVLDNRRPWLCLGDDLAFPWVAPPNLGRTDEQMLELADGPLTLLYDPTAPMGGPLHTWPPDRRELWFHDAAGRSCVSVSLEGEIRVQYSEPVAGPVALSGRLYSPRQFERDFGPVTPVPAPDGASC